MNAFLTVVNDDTNCYSHLECVIEDNITMYKNTLKEPHLF